MAMENLTSAAPEIPPTFGPENIAPNVVSRVDAAGAGVNALKVAVPVLGLAATAALMWNGLKMIVTGRAPWDKK
jgi:hypothetical protein